MHRRICLSVQLPKKKTQPDEDDCRKVFSQGLRVQFTKLSALDEPVTMLDIFAVEPDPNRSYTRDFLALLGEQNQLNTYVKAWKFS